LHGRYWSLIGTFSKGAPSGHVVIFLVGGQGRAFAHQRKLPPFGTRSGAARGAGASGVFRSHAAEVLLAETT
jgi:hypothetical protein